MALMKTREIRELDAPAMRVRLRELQADLFNERGQSAMGGAPANPGRIRMLRTQIARIKTVLKEVQ